MYEFLIKNYIVNEERTRQCGKTTALIEACKKVNGIYLVDTEFEANLYSKRYNVDARVPREINLRGTSKPLIFDHCLLLMVLSEKLGIDYSYLLKKLNVNKNKMYYLLEKIRKSRTK